MQNLFVICYSLTESRSGILSTFECILFRAIHETRALGHRHGVSVASWANLYIVQEEICLARADAFALTALR